ncbi:helix-turn-helix transcriptional regulator [Xanthobacter sp. DSM 24535]|uniref:helix-turn-helix domain-containing protein n=1 Tax=Roseixanthobacter psychrophilus TaxID=3119917 RepID=UPI00372C5347
MSALLHIRTELFKISQAEMARIAETTQATVSRWENGRSSPDLTHLERIRAAAQERGVKLKDAIFFAAPRARAREEGAE